MNANLTEIFSGIDAYLYKFKPEAVDRYNGIDGVDDKARVGVMAQELQENPLTQETVVENENGELEVDIRHLVFVLTAVVSDMAKEIEILKEKIGE